MSRDWPQDPTMVLKRYGNFKPDRFAESAGRQPWANRREKREGNSNRHLFLVKSLPCLICGVVGPSDPHHLRHDLAAKERGVGQKATDRWTLPLCRNCHGDVHALGSRREREWFEDHGYQALALADALWVNSGDLSRLHRVLLAHKLAASRELLMRRKP